MKLFALFALLIASLSGATAQVTAFAPTSLVGRSAVVIIGSGTAPFATSGGYRIQFATTDLTYRITRITGPVLNTTGTYTYARQIGDPNQGIITAVDSVSGALRMSLHFDFNATEATFQILPPAVGSQVGSQAGAVFMDPVGTTIQNITLAVSGLANLSVRAVVPAGGQVIPAFVLDTASTVLVRASGPALAAFGVTGTISNPMLKVLSGTDVVAQNDDWGATASEAGARVGAFPLAQGSKDAAVVVSLPAGAYTCLVTDSPASTGTRGGEVLVEVYRVPN